MPPAFRRPKSTSAVQKLATSRLNIISAPLHETAKMTHSAADTDVEDESEDSQDDVVA